MINIISVVIVLTDQKAALRRSLCRCLVLLFGYIEGVREVVAGATGIEPISTVLETAILTVVLRPYNTYYSRYGRVWGEVG